jgi:hypothetical protein
MKKLIPASVFILAAAIICSFALYGCGATGDTKTSAAQSNALTLDQVLQKSAETRQQIQDAKTAAAAAQTANQATGAGKSTAATIKDAAKEYAGEAAKPVVEEYDAWKKTLAK